MSVQPYIRPSYTEPIPRGLNLAQFIQTVIVGVTGITGTLVRPEWQPDPPKQPDNDINWIGFGISSAEPDANSYIDVDAEERTVSQRHELLDVTCSIYGPDAIDTYGLLRDGLQIPQNLQALATANMGFVEIARAQHLPDKVNERWIDRVVTSLFFRREIQRRYPIVTLVSCEGTIHTVIGDEEYLLNFAVNP